MQNPQPPKTQAEIEAEAQKLIERLGTRDALAVASAITAIVVKRFLPEETN